MLKVNVVNAYYTIPHTSNQIAVSTITYVSHIVIGSQTLRFCLESQNISTSQT